jgi:sulfide:quinone oxidoreductase
MANGKHQVLIVGGGTAGITVAAILRRRARDIDIAVVEPAEEHYYQPALTLVGGGVYPLAKTHRPEASVMPPGVTWIRGAAQTFEPDKNTVRLQNGDALTYDYLVVCTGVKLDWVKIAGLAETLGRNGVCSNYSPKTVSYTWECVQALKAGDKVVCTQPPMPFKCPGAPQKIVYLIADRLRRRGILKDCKLDFYTQGPAIFGVAYFARALVKVAARYGIGVHYQQNLVAVDGNAKTATFEFVGDARKGEKGDRAVRPATRLAAAVAARRDQIEPACQRGRLGRGQPDHHAARAFFERLFARRCVFDTELEDRGGRAQAGAGGGG